MQCAFHLSNLERDRDESSQSSLRFRGDAQGLRTWVECEGPTWDAGAVNRMLDIAARDVALMGAAIERIVGRQDPSPTAPTAASLPDVTPSRDAIWKRRRATAAQYCRRNASAIRTADSRDCGRGWWASFALPAPAKKPPSKAGHGAMCGMTPRWHGNC